MAARRGALRRAIRPPVRPGWLTLSVATGLGALAAAGQEPLGLWPITLIALTGIAWLIANAPSPGNALWRGWLAGAGHFAAALFWIVEPFLIDAPRHGWMAPFALVLMAFGLGLFWALAGGAAHWLGGRTAGLRALALAPALGAAELARGHLFTGFPWAMPGHVWIDTPVAQIAALVGASGLTFLTLLIAALPLMTGPGHSRRVAGAVVAAGLIASGWWWGTQRLDSPLPTPEDEISLRLVQPNAPQHLKWDAEWARVFLNRQLDQTAALTVASGAPRPDLVIWSETAIPWLLDDAEPVIEMIAEAADGVPVALGVQRREEGRFFNSLALIGRDGRVGPIYDKHHLVPFGEYVPFAEALAGTRLGGIAARQLAGYSPGPGPALMDLGAAGVALPLICYEAVFPHLLRATARPDWLLQVTNDAWFGRIAGPYQHLAQARFRAVEMGLPLVRAANTGVSAVIDARGRILGRIGLNEEGFLDATLPGVAAPTVFARHGEAPLALLLAGLLAWLALRRRSGWH